MEWYASDDRLAGFIATVRPIFQGSGPIQDRLAAARPHFHDLLMQDGWLPDGFAKGDPTSGMGGGIGTWLLYRDDNDGMALFSLVVEPGAITPIHDHLRWGLVGLYQGRQVEYVYERTDGDALKIGERRILDRGGIYDLIPPENDIHSVTTISPDPSISIHLLGGDIGCLWRHRFDLEAGTALPFRSGYSNVPCKD